mmetsp:Transcript_63424/g.182016  ORF Transcript_63424/g.182016 Transcript_63424/m.182016 type:complete len:230 (+) Transcript_63424:1205-1894(+)
MVLVPAPQLLKMPLRSTLDRLLLQGQHALLQHTQLATLLEGLQTSLACGLPQALLVLDLQTLPLLICLELELDVINGALQPRTHSCTLCTITSEILLLCNDDLSEEVQLAVLADDGVVQPFDLFGFLLQLFVFGLDDVLHLSHFLVQLLQLFHESRPFRAALLSPQLHALEVLRRLLVDLCSPPSDICAICLVKLELVRDLFGGGPRGISARWLGGFRDDVAYLLEVFT